MFKGLTIALILTIAACNPVSYDCHYNEHGDYHCHEQHNYTGHDHEVTHSVYYDSSYSYQDNSPVVYVTDNYCDDSPPYYHDAQECFWSTLDEVCCVWLNIGAEELWCMNDYSCGWQLEVVAPFI